jgi:hypothetical protein
MMRRMAMGLAAILAMALVAGPAAAQTGSLWMGTVFVGYSKIMESSDDAAYGVPGGGLAAHGNVFRMFSPVLGAGVEVGYQHYGEEAFDIPPTVEVAGQKGDAGFSSVHLTAQGIARGGTGKWRPYGTVGAGWYSLRATLSGQFYLGDGTPLPNNTFEDKGSDSKFGANLGGGLLYKPANSSMSFGIEARWHAIFDAWTTADGSSALDVMTLMAGVHFN